MIDTKNYAARLEKKLIDKFKDDFKEKIGYEPVVISNIYQMQTNPENKLPSIDLEVLKGYFTPFLPEINGKIRELSSRIRKRELVELRNIYCYLAKQMGYTLYVIGRSLGNRDHTTIIHNINSFKNLIEQNDLFREKYNTILKLIKSDYESPVVENVDQVQYESEPAVLS